MNDAKLRAWWSHRQGLDGTLAGATAAEVLERSGWARSVAGVGPYLTLHARAGIGRAAADRAVAQRDVLELPAARGCTYVVPSSDFALALRVGQAFAGAEMKVAARLGVTAAEVDRLCAAVVTALASAPLDPDGIREAVGGAARSLGEEGKKKGVTTTLPIALGRLQAEGEIRRVPANGRLDQQRYRYALWRPNPLAGLTLSPEEANVALARRWFRWAGPATAAELQGFSGLGVKAAQAAAAPLRLLPIEAGSDRLLPAEDHEAFRAFEPPAQPRYALVASLDAMISLRRDVAALLDERDAERPTFGDKKTAALRSFRDLPHHAILDRGRLVGLWDFDPGAGAVVWTSFGIEDEALTAAVAHTEAYVQGELGDARSFSLDSPESRAPRLQALREEAGRGPRARKR